MSELQKRLRAVRREVWGTNDYAPDSLCCEAADALDALVEETSTQAQEIARLAQKDAAAALLISQAATTMASQTAEIETLRARAEAAADALAYFGRHADHCGDADAYNHADVRSCGCGLDAAIDAARGGA